MDIGDKTAGEWVVPNSLVGEISTPTDNQNALVIGYEKLTEQDIGELLEIRDFVRLFIQHNPEAQAIFTALRAKKRIEK